MILIGNLGGDWASDRRSVRLTETRKGSVDERLGRRLGHNGKSIPLIETAKIALMGSSKRLGVGERSIQSTKIGEGGISERFVQPIKISKGSIGGRSRRRQRVGWEGAEKDD